MLVQRDILRSIVDNLLKFHKWFKHGLKAQQLLGGCVISHIQYALKGQKHLAQGIALGFRTNTKKSP